MNSPEYKRSLLNLNKIYKWFKNDIENSSEIEYFLNYNLIILYQLNLRYYLNSNRKIKIFPVCNLSSCNLSSINKNINELPLNFVNWSQSLGDSEMIKSIKVTKLDHISKLIGVKSTWIGPSNNLDNLSDYREFKNSHPTEETDNFTVANYDGYNHYRIDVPSLELGERKDSTTLNFSNNNNEEICRKLHITPEQLLKLSEPETSSVIIVGRTNVHVFFDLEDIEMPSEDDHFAPNPNQFFDPRKMIIELKNEPTFSEIDSYDHFRDVFKLTLEDEMINKLFLTFQIYVKYQTTFFLLDIKSPEIRFDDQSMLMYLNFYLNFYKDFGYISVKLDLPNQLTHIQNIPRRIFSSIQQINLPDNLQQIIANSKGSFDGSFEKFNQLSGIIFPKNIELIGRKSFYECDSLKFIIFSSDFDSKV